MKNFRHAGRTCTFIAPYAVASGGGFQVGGIFAVANTDAAQGAEVEGDVEGVVSLPKAVTNGSATDAWTKAYWDNTAKVVTKTAGANILIGAFTQAVGDAVPSVGVRLNGTIA